MGWLCVKYQYDLCMIRLWNRLIKMSRHILDQMNETNYIIEEREIDLKDIKFHLSDIMHIEWSNTVGHKPKLRNYAKFKTFTLRNML